MRCAITGKNRLFLFWIAFILLGGFMHHLAKEISFYLKSSLN